MSVTSTGSWSEDHNLFYDNGGDGVTGANAIEVDPAIRVEAVKSIQRMLDFARAHGISGKLPGNA